MKKYAEKNLLNIYFKILKIFVVIIALFMGICIYVLNVRINEDNNNINWSSWPVSFTTNFYKEISSNEDGPQLTDAAIEDLSKYKLSFQMIDKNGDVILAYNELQGAKKHYSAIEIVQLYKTGGSHNNYTMFVGIINNESEEYAYIIGFPAKISKVTMYFNYKNYINVKYIILILSLFIIIGVLLYGIIVNKTLLKIVSSIKSISLNSEEASEKFVPLKEKGIYKDVFHNINFLNDKLKASEEERKKTENLREEWIANISHDLKTPLSPIRGYAEILSDPEYNVDPKEAERYGKIILRNVESVETIVENLNFTYKLKNGIIPIDFKERNMVRLLKEVIIGILNHPKYEKRNISFICSEDKINFKFDNTLLYRAFTNILYNSVIHNSSDTIIKVTIEKKDKIYINIQDNGKGMEESELKKLFERYYGGTKSSVNVKGSGLGMAIAKQIIEAHGGNIDVRSKIDIGTSITIIFAL